MQRCARFEALRVICSGDGVADSSFKAPDAQGACAPLCVFCGLVCLKALVLQPASRGLLWAALFAFGVFGRARLRGGFSLDFLYGPRNR